MSYFDPGRPPPDLEELERTIIMCLQAVAAALIVGIMIELLLRAGATP